nr:hypothetical protein BaRGS_016042 [Batillaria attramentaria]
MNGGHRYTQIDSVTNMRRKYELRESDDSVYNEPDDVTNRKLPPTPGPNDSQAKEDAAIVSAPKQPSAPLSADYSFAHNPTEETVFTAQDANGKTGRKASKELQGKDGCTFFLDEEEANGKNDSNKMTRPHAAAVAAASSDRSSHDYSALDSSDRARNSNSHDGEYTPLRHTPDEEQGDKPEDLNDVDGAKGQYFVLENANDGGETQDDTANEPQADEQGKDGQYFILEENA